MKKIFTSILFFVCTTGVITSQAATHMIEVEDFEFSPAAITVNTGDTIVWIWDEGSHTTTSTLIPGGATPWNAPMNVNSPVFMYMPMVAGSYDYVCSPHASMGMAGHFTVVDITGVNDRSLTGATLNGIFRSDDELTISYDLPAATLVSVQLFDALGNHVNTLLSAARQPAGTYQQKFLLSSLKTGVYILQLRTAHASLSRRILVP